MRILVCHNFYRQPGGERRYVEQQVELLRRRGHRVSLLTRDSAEIDGWSALDRLRFPAAAVDSARTRAEVREAVGRERPQVAHVHNVFPLLSPSLYRALHAAGVPIVQTVHNYRFLCPNGLFFTHGAPCERCKRGNTLHAVRLRCYRDSYAFSALYATSIGLHRRLGTFGRIDRFVAPSSFCAEKVVEGGLDDGGRVRTLRHFLPTPLPAVGAPAEPPYALYLGRLSPEKGVGLLLEAMALLPHRRLAIAGAGPSEAVLRREAAERGLDNVAFHGFVSGDEKRRLLAAAWATVVPSSCYETFSYALHESLAAGVPAVVAGHGSLASLVADGREGLCFRPGDARDLADRLERLFADAPLRARLAAGGRRTIEEECTEDVHHRRLSEIYREVAA